MCTLTLLNQNDTPAGSASGVAGRSAFRLMMNRDELRDRPLARPPQVFRRGRHDATWPIDPPSGGTWIAVNDAGVVAALLNVSPDPMSHPARQLPQAHHASRGSLIPSLMDCDTAAGAASRFDELNWETYPPFRLVIVDGRHIAEAISDGLTYSHAVQPMDGASRMYASSSLGDALVDKPRRELFCSMFEGVNVDGGDVGHGASDATAGFAIQDAFHRHRWVGREALSVCMSRPDACTVSLTEVSVSSTGSAAMRYFGQAPAVDMAPPWW